MMWRRAVLAAVAVVAAFATETRAEFACSDGQFPVSVLDDPHVKCLASRPCSGVYGPEGLLIGVGACPSGTGCALLPHNPSVMGCVAEGRADVSYVNPDGSLSRGGKVIAGPPTAPPTNGGSGGGANNSTAPTAAPTSTPVPSSTPVATTTDPGHVKPGGATGSSSGTTEGAVSKLPSTTTPATDGSTETTDLTPTTTPEPTSASTSQQNALDDISGEVASNKRSEDGTSGLGFGSIIAIVVGCLAVVAVIAGVFVLRKKKEQAIGTPEGALEDYGAGGVTPKENVLLL